MMGRLEYFRNWFLKTPDSWTWLINWLNEYPSPPLGMAQATVLTLLILVNLNIKIRSNYKRKELACQYGNLVN